MFKVLKHFEAAWLMKRLSTKSSGLETYEIVTLVSCALALTASALSQQKARTVKNRRQIFTDEPHTEWLRN
jgi:hypothetical protein